MRKQIIQLTVLFLIISFSVSSQKKYDNRAYWVSVLTKISNPVLINLAEEKLRVNMPIECKDPKRKEVAHLEAFGRTLVGIAPGLSWELMLHPKANCAKNIFFSHVRLLPMQLIQTRLIF